jgi:drug/metabolite transporter (DMT)-like permease
MWPEVIAILSATGWACDSVLVRLGARRSNILAAAFLSYSVSALSLWMYLLLFSSLDLLWSRATLYFLLGGCLQPLIARILFYVGLTRLGASRAGPLRGVEPLFSAVIAVVFLQERPGFLVYGGTVLIVASVWLISRRESGESRWRLFDIQFPLGAALVSAVSQNLRKGGLLILPDPFVGTAVSTATSLALLLIFLLATRKMNLVRIERESLPFFGTGAIVSAMAQLLNFMALSRGEVSVMVPLLNTTPLFTVLFSSLFLREVEKVTLRIVLGAALMVAGVVIITRR